MSLLKHKDAQALLEDAQVDVSTVRGCRQRLTVFLKRYLPLFYREEQREHAQLVLQGRLSNLERKTSEPVARRVGVSRRPIQLFVGAGAWDDEAVMAEVRRHLIEELRDSEGTFVLDSSGFPKKGTESCGVQRQWCGRLGKIDNCQVGVFLACVWEGRVAPVDRRLYLPPEWAKDSERRRKCHVPSSVRFAEKWQIGLRMIEKSRDVPHDWIVADDEYGRVREFRARLRKRRERYIVDVPANTLVRLAEPTSAKEKGRKIRKKKSRGRRRVPPWERADKWAARQPAASWRRIEVRPGEKGPLTVDVLQSAAETPGKVRERLIVIRTVETVPKTHYCLSNAKDKVPIEEIVEAHGDRHPIERMFGLGNGEVGLDHYEVRSWVGWHHHMTLSLLGLWFLVLEQERIGKKNTSDHGAPGTNALQPVAADASANGGDDRQQHHRHAAT